MSVRFNPPPLWLQHLPANFQPTPSWTPENAWGAPPVGWPLWIQENGYPAQPPAEFANNPFLYMSVMPDFNMVSATAGAPGPRVPAGAAQLTQDNSLPGHADPKKPLSKGKKIGIGVAGVIVLLIMIGSCGGSEEQPSSAPAATTSPAPQTEAPAAAVAAAPEPSESVEPTAEPTAEPDSTEEPEPAQEPEPEPEPEVTLPKAQQAFSERVAKAAATFDETDNELRMTKALNDRNKALCKATGGSFSGWKATVADVGSTGDGYGYFSVIMEDDIELSTWNNALSDIGDDTLIKPTNKLFNTLLDLSSGDTVTVSGTFLRGDSCVKTSNVTEVFDASSPDFKVDFSSVKVD